MKKFVFGIIAIIVVGIVVVSLPKQENEEDKPIAEAGEETIENDDCFYINPMSDKDIYFKPDTVLPDNPGSAMKMRLKMRLVNQIVRNCE